MRVYRLQTIAGRGPYQGAYRSDVEGPCPTYLAEEYTGGDRDRHPAPGPDGIFPPFHDQEFFGFESPQQMRDWFFAAPHDPLALTRRGLWITEWEVPQRHVRRGGKQVVFRRDLATMRARHDPRDIDEVYPEPCQAGGCERPLRAGHDFCDEHLSPAYAEPDDSWAVWLDENEDSPYL